MRAWVLYGERCGYFKQMTGIGPACTKNLGEAELFRTKTEALQSPAMYHSLVDFAPLRVKVTKGKVSR